METVASQLNRTEIVNCLIIFTILSIKPEGANNPCLLIALSHTDQPIDKPGPVGSIIYADLCGSIKIKFTVLIRDTDQ